MLNLFSNGIDTEWKINIISCGIQGLKNRYQNIPQLEIFGF